MKAKKERFVPLEKSSKKTQREFYAGKRRDWNGMNPVTRVAERSKKYNRAKTKEALSRSDMF